MSIGHTHRRPRRPHIPLVLLSHPFEFCLGVVLVVLGIRGVFGSHSPSTAELPPVPLALYLTVSTLGGIGVILGLSFRDPREHFGLGITLERASLYLVAAAYTARAVLVLAYSGSDGISTALLSTLIAAACILRAVAIRRATHIVLEQLKRANRDEVP